MGVLAFTTSFMSAKQGSRSGEDMTVVNMRERIRDFVGRTARGGCVVAVGPGGWE